MASQENFLSSHVPKQTPNIRLFLLDILSLYGSRFIPVHNNRPADRQPASDRPTHRPIQTLKQDNNFEVDEWTDSDDGPLKFLIDKQNRQP